MAKYSKEFKYSIMMKMMPPQNQAVSEIARETGLSEATLINGESKPEPREWRFQVVNRKLNAGVLKISF